MAGQSHVRGGFLPATVGGPGPRRLREAVAPALHTARAPSLPSVLGTCASWNSGLFLAQIVHMACPRTLGECSARVGSPRTNHQSPTTNRRHSTPTATNRQPPTTNHQPPPTANL